MAIKLISVTKLNQNIMNGTRETGKYNDWRDNIKSENAIYNEIIENCKPEEVKDVTSLNLQDTANHLGGAIKTLEDLVEGFGEGSELSDEIEDEDYKAAERMDAGI